MHTLEVILGLFIAGSVVILFIMGFFLPFNFKEGMGMFLICWLVFLGASGLLFVGNFGLTLLSKGLGG
jgi:TRAP-type C4-dicarboxylate transport system permease small subunit